MLMIPTTMNTLLPRPTRVAAPIMQIPPTSPLRRRERLPQPREAMPRQREDTLHPREATHHIPHNPQRIRHPRPQSRPITLKITRRTTRMLTQPREQVTITCSPFRLPII
ncbi:hypothetical protein M430DRAFT_156450 [Amorphotheca resinae ATCC 22711]|uniref:Uncharacterized protein n=1 Tax=Amorphotheca resinae ATCC 22711 TaxID=857342 RepID=A0A2T3BE07_AMORE|nr:hypothetical protein M430DRAFT_156450 [Amorphotheca resinae ATCC 22711]PSS27626.1 hypothetical protein M430DRAFT_156450 [Amorphotheca resinae ATCC 22711]